MNIRCPNCGAVFPGPAAGRDAECPLCLHTFTPDGNVTAAASEAAPLPSAHSDGEDEFESFGAPMGGGATTTFGGGDPFAPGGSDPFAGGGGADPFASSGADPFGSGGDSDSPAGNARSAPAATDDPFAAPAGSGAEDVDFGALLGNVGQPSDDDADPFGMPVDGGGDGLFGDSGDFGAKKFASGEFGGDDFGGGGAATDDELFGDDSEDSLFLATANTSGAIFDEGEDDDLLLGQDDASEHEERAESDVSRTPLSDDQREPRNFGPLIDRLVIGGIIVLSIGIALDYQGLPVFGLGDFLPSVGGGDEASVQPLKARQRPIPQNLSDPTDIKDSAATYQLEIARLTKVREVRPNDPKILRALVSAYLDLMERMPTVFAADAAYRKELETLLTTSKLQSPRFAVLDPLSRGDMRGIQDKIDALRKVPEPTADDVGTTAWALFQLEMAEVQQSALDNPGRISNPSIDPMVTPRPHAKRIKEAKKLADRALKMAEGASNRIKFVMLQARIDDISGNHEAHIKGLQSFAPTAKDAVEARLLLVSGLIRGNHLGKAANELKALALWAQDEQDSTTLLRVYLQEAWLAHRRGRVDDQITALNAAKKLNPDDELTTVRLGRLLLKQKRAQECIKMLSEAKKRGLGSIAFEVALVEYWLWAHRNDDALAEIKHATARFPESVDLLFLRGQVEEQQQHTATARDFYSKVIAREPKHLRATLRLATLQSKAGRHDDALSTLSNARSKLGALASILELMAQELVVLKRTAEARKIYGELLKRQPSHKVYLLNAARMDVKAGHIDAALKSLLILQAEGGLDREGAKQLAMALASKGKPGDAAKTLVKFADREPNDIRLNALSGQYMLDSGNLERADTLLKRAFRVAHRQGGDAETLFQYGRLAFRQKEVSKGISRMKQAIKAAPKRHDYRYTFAKALLAQSPKSWPSAGDMATSQLKWLIAHAERLESTGHKIEYLAEVYRTLAIYYMDIQRFAKAIPMLRKSLALEPSHLRTRVNLGNAMFRMSDPKAEKVLRDVLKRQPNNHVGAMYLGLTLQNKGRVSESIVWLTRATRGKGSETAEAWYQLAIIHRDRKQHGKVTRYLREFLKRASKTNPYRADAVSLLSQLGG
ncbi:MAG: tetratricopeptide repeat protein [Myxococcales bacterium]|nr:tetratricopeptide repeat protein [Myxococcales bacterium]